MSKNKAYNEFESFLNECNIYIWEWYIPEQFVRFGIPSLDGLWTNEKEKIFKLATVLERVHPDDVDKIFVRRTSPIYKSDNMFEIDLRIMHGGQGQYEWYGFRGQTQKRDKMGRPTYIRGVAINVDQRVRAQRKLLARKDRNFEIEKQKSSYFSSVLQEVQSFIRTLVSNSDSIIMSEDRAASSEERLLRLNEIKEQAAHIADLLVKMRSLLGDKELESETLVKKISLWEHLAELQQVFSLKMSNSLKLYFSNMYDDSSIKIDVKLFDLLLENVINTQIHNARHGSLIMNYSHKNQDTLLITITCTENEKPVREFEQQISETGLGLSVCRLVAQRLYGDIEVVNDPDGRIQYQILLPLVPPVKYVEESPIKLNVLDELDEEEDLGVGNETSARPHVLIGIQAETDIFMNQHLFEVTTTHTTEQLLQTFIEKEQDIVFIDSNLKGSISIFDLITAIREQSSDTPIIVTADYAVRPLHKKIRSLGAQYLLTNPLSLRKVNLMIKKYLK